MKDCERKLSKAKSIKAQADGKIEELKQNSIQKEELQISKDKIFSDLKSNYTLAQQHREKLEGNISKLDDTVRKYVVTSKEFRKEKSAITAQHSL